MQHKCCEVSTIETNQVNWALFIQWMWCCLLVLWKDRFRCYNKQTPCRPSIVCLSVCSVGTAEFISVYKIWSTEYKLW